MVNMINPMVANKELCDIVLPYYGLNSIVATKLVNESNMSPQNKAYLTPEILQLFHDMRRYFRINELDKHE
jgi:hypothetical protein